MFGNRLINYGSPGGQRRGLIWQSGETREKIRDPRDYIFFNGQNFVRYNTQSPNVTPLLYYNPFSVNRQVYTVGSTTYEGYPYTFGWRPNYVKDRPRHLDPTSGWTSPWQAPWHTTYVPDGQGGTVLSIIAWEEIYKAEIDDYWIPPALTGFIPDPIGGSYGSFPPNGYQSTGMRQIFADESTQSQYYDYYDTSHNPEPQFLMVTDNSPDPRKNLYIGAGSSAPFHIKGTAIYVDYYYCLFPEAGSFSRLDPHAITQAFALYLDSIGSYHDQDGTMGGAIIPPRHTGTGYDMPWPTWQADSGEAVDWLTPGGVTPSQSGYMQEQWTGYRYTKGVTHRGSPYESLMYLSPCIPPFSDMMPYFTYNRSLPSSPDQLSKSGKRDLMFDECFLSFPYINQYTITSGKPRIAYTDYRFNAGWRGSSYATQYNQISRWQDPYTELNKRALVAHAIQRAGSGVTNTITQHWDITTQSQMRAKQLLGMLQPQWRRGQKLMLNVFPVVASYNIDNYGTMPTAGKYQLAAFKGTISFFDFDHTK